jgi:hypothetical protein
MQASSEDIKEMLEEYGESSGIGITSNNIFIGREPSKPKNCITIFDTIGFHPYLGLGPGDTGFEYPSIQIRVRNDDYQTGWALIERIKTALHGRAQETWNATLYSLIYCSSGPAHLDWDDNGNALFIINFNIQRRAV